MFGMEHMLKDGWSGFYSQGYMYFDNCSSLLLPKVSDNDTVLDHCRWHLNSFIMCV